MKTQVEPHTGEQGGEPPGFRVSSSESFIKEMLVQLTAELRPLEGGARYIEDPSPLLHYHKIIESVSGHDCI